MSASPLAFVKDALVDSISNIPLPREAVLVNFRLGLFFRFLQACAIGGAIYVVTYNNVQEYKPTSIDIDFWRSPANPGAPEPAHCLSESMPGYAYKYDATEQYAPTGCKTLGKGEDYSKALESMFFMSYVKDETIRSGSGDECLTLTQSACEGAGGAYTASDGDCECTYTHEYYVKNQEKNKFLLRHYYRVQDSWDGSSIQAGSSKTPFYTSGPPDNMKQYDGKMLTMIMTSTGEPCSVGGKSQYLPEDGDIGGSIEDWLACGGYTLDSTSDKTRSYNDIEDGKAPQLRTSGVKINIELSYKNDHKEIGDNQITTVCELKVHVLPSWNSRPTTDYTIYKDAAMDKPEQRYRHRYAHGVSFHFQKGGSFKFFNPNALLTGIVNAIVLIGIPMQIIRYLALYAVGVVSKIYTSVLRQQFSIFHQFHGLSARMMVSSTGFRTLTKQWDQRAQNLKGLSRQNVCDYMMDAFNHELRKRDVNGKRIVEEDEVLKLANVVTAGLDVDGQGSVSYDEFVHSCSSHEHVDTKTMIKFFDDERKLRFGEWLFDPTRAQIMELQERLREMKGRQSTAGIEESMKANRTPSTTYGEEAVGQAGSETMV